MHCGISEALHTDRHPFLTDELAGVEASERDRIEAANLDAAAAHEAYERIRADRAQAADTRQRFTPADSDDYHL